ncbi:hypothetical protein DENIS_3191 [Desulfonema ishimotonii]|uniref:Nitroreductase domain-containing protein n=1 Tax=Desulfonema ishimotonii TaxID=45657 RepID=A0A401FYZ9_9BACT|nr:nitroreductase family protein [Desulfonema ishimotonii]GBC62222.1 hypothetical protein DENIS_3191 [Desulfonema ishimotonii]
MTVSAFIKRLIGKMLRAILPERWIRILRNPVLLPGDYGRIAAEFETVRDMKEAQKAADDEYSAAVLRKCAHIIDKGLHRPDFEPGHSSPFHQAAIQTLGNLRSDAVINEGSVSWARQKIQEYEARQSSPVRISEPFVPHSDIGYDQLMTLIRDRRSIRFYTRKTVGKEAIFQIAEAANWAPASCNRQTIRIFAATDPALARKCMATCKGATCFSEFVPGFLSFCADLRSYAFPHEFMLPMIDVSLGTQNSCLAAHTLGLSITLLSWSQKSEDEDRELRRLLNIPAHYMIIVNGAIGYPACNADTPVRKSPDASCVIR